MLNLYFQRIAAASLLTLAMAGCGGGSNAVDASLSPTAATPPSDRPSQVDGLGYTQAMLNSGPKEDEEPQAVDQIELSSSDSDEPDPSI